MNGSKIFPLLDPLVCEISDEELTIVHEKIDKYCMYCAVLHINAMNTQKTNIIKLQDIAYVYF